ncbi:MAG: hypothetical protein M3P33_01675, partial [bacterium]|nr:hypothetical protein [bacterium]
MFRNPSLYFLILLCLMLALVPGYSYYRYLSFNGRPPSFQETPKWFKAIEASAFPVFTGSDEVPEVSAEG